MPKADALENGLLGLIFQAVAIANLADNAGTAPLTSLFVSLHTATPGDAGDQSTNEAAYTSYARIGVVRTSSGWALAANVITPVADIEFPEATGGTETETFIGIGTLVSGAGVLYYYGAITPNISVVTGVAPVIRDTSTITED